MKTLDEIKGEMLLTDKEIKVREDEYWELYRDLWNAYEIDEADYESGFDYWRLEAQIDKVLSIPISKGGVCPACNGEKYITLRGIIGDVDEECFKCNGTGTVDITVRDAIERINKE